MGRGVPEFAAAACHPCFFLGVAMGSSTTEGSLEEYALPFSLRLATLVLACNVRPLGPLDLPISELAVRYLLD